MNFFHRIGAYWQLGLKSIADVLIYRIGLVSGLHPALHIRPVEAAREEDFFARPDFPRREYPVTPVWRDRPWAFGYPAAEPTTNPPDWHANILTGQRTGKPFANWNDISAFSEELGDIKTVWEASRFDWVLAFAQAAACGDSLAYEKLNSWLKDWASRNPPYKGPNWMCGQEASLRVAHLALAAKFLGQEKRVSPVLEALLLNHLRRIAPTLAYARGQDNNHAISEGMGLFVGGLWLSRIGETDHHRTEGTKYSQMGRALLEERVNKLVFDDGGFSQYSMTYHRLMLDSLSLSEYWRKFDNAVPFSENFYAKATSAANWLTYFTDDQSGDVPNLGSNDGAWLLPVGSGTYRDFRPSCTLASILFSRSAPFIKCESASSLVKWFDLKYGKVKLPVSDKADRCFTDSGIVAFKKGQLRIFLRLPGYKFRPLQADALHLDGWLAGENSLHDAGTYSYAVEGWSYFPSTAAHNTIEFDGSDQMPRIGRFLYGRWLKRGSLDFNQEHASASYTDFRGNAHQRSISFDSPNNLRVVDQIDGKFNRAVLRWRLRDIPYKLDKNILSQSGLRICIEATQSIVIRIVRSPSSLFYLQKFDIPVLEVEFSQSGTIVSHIRFDRSED